MHFNLTPSTCIYVYLIQSQTRNCRTLLSPKMRTSESSDPAAQAVMRGAHEEATGAEAPMQEGAVVGLGPSLPIQLAQVGKSLILKTFWSYWDLISHYTVIFCTNTKVLCILRCLFFDMITKNLLSWQVKLALDVHAYFLWFFQCYGIQTVTHTQCWREKESCPMQTWAKVREVATANGPAAAATTRNPAWWMPPLSQTARLAPVRMDWVRIIFT